ncbi:hypothetical protein DFH09DRAFT_1201023 [Mycena vulgaris]|nr:hypothetical protein DFH09DRAFT_1201023 [Mycena vulgaris]
MNKRRTAQEILDEYKRFRILTVGRAGGGKSSLINRVFNVKDAKVSDSKPGEAEIDLEITSETNKLFVLHDSKGFEPSKADTFHIVEQFIRDRSDKDLQLKDRLHAAWLCIRTPFSGARVLETGDENFLKIAHDGNIPVVVVFTQYDTFVTWFEEQCDNCKSCSECEKCMNLETCEKRKSSETCENCKTAAKDVYNEHVKSLEDAAIRLGIPTPEHINVSVRDGYTENIVPLVDKTEKLVEKHLPEDDAWYLWALAQMVSLPLKIRACADQAMTHYSRALIATGSTPAVGRPLLFHRLVEVHEDIITCMNVQDPDNVLRSTEFKHVLLHVVQHMRNKEDTKSSPFDIEKITQVVQLFATASAALAQPAAILGLSFTFFKWLLDAICANVPEVQRVFISYAVDLMLVLRELFDFTLQRQWAGRITWGDLGEAWAAYHRTPSQARVHSEITELVKEHEGLSADSKAIHESVVELLRKHRAIGT